MRISDKEASTASRNSYGYLVTRQDFKFFIQLLNESSEVLFWEA